MELKIGDSWEGVTATITTEQAEDLLGALSNGTDTSSNNPVSVTWIGSMDADITYVEGGFEDYTQQYKGESLKELIKIIENELEG